MAGQWQSLVANIAVVALFVSAWVNAQVIVSKRPRRWRSIAFGVGMGTSAIASMMLAVDLAGAPFDLSLAMIAIAGFFGGPLSGLLAAGLAVGYRLAIGGNGVVFLVGAVGLVLAGGLAVAWTGRNQRLAPFGSLMLAALVAVVSQALGLVLPVSAPAIVLNTAATLTAALFIARHRAIDYERELLQAAFLQSPDLQYVKTPESRFAAVNQRVAQFHGYGSPLAIIGKSDHDLMESRRAGELRAAERDVMESRMGFSDCEELSRNSDGTETWFSTSKLPLTGVDGEVIGLAGVTRDISSRKRLETEVTKSRNELAYVLSGVSDGIAMFDRSGHLAYCNDQYGRHFPMTRDMRVPGASFRDILRAVVATGEQVGIPAGREDEWIETIAATLNAEGEQEINLSNGNWLHLRTKPTGDGIALVVVSDVTKIKEAESTLREMTSQLRLLATTDGMTGLLNRRALDQALDAEVARMRRQHAPLSLLLVDVDRFKAYNDLYGHQAGDEVLKAVAKCLTDVLKRPGDLAARYGGEEFVGIVSGTDEDGAFFIADAFRERLRSLALTHRGGDKGVVTASVGIATFGAEDSAQSASELIRRADEALYDAKAAGRDRVMGWRARHEVMPLASNGK